MYRYIKAAARAFEESAPRACVLGVKIGAVAIVVASVGFGIAVTLSERIGQPIMFGGILAGLCGMVVYYVGGLRKTAQDTAEAKRARNGIENGKQPWERNENA